MQGINPKTKFIASLAFAGAISGYSLWSVVLQLHSGIKPWQPDAPIEEMTAIALLAAIVPSLAAAFATVRGPAARLLWLVLAAVLDFRIFSEIFIDQVHHDSPGLLLANWVAMSALLIAALRRERIGSLFRRWGWTVVFVHAFSAILGIVAMVSPLGKWASEALIWSSEALDAMDAAGYAVLLGFIAAMLAVKHLASTPAPVFRSTVPATFEARALARFHPCPVDPTCAYCHGHHENHVFYDWSFAGAIYCISLADREDRTRSATAEFHKVGICRQLIFYRPERLDSSPIEGIWNSHREVARHAIAGGYTRALIFEDDVKFVRSLEPERVARIASSLRRLPADWQVFFLGHWPLRMKFLARDLVQTASGCCHAYIANRPMLEWLATSDYHVLKVTGRRNYIGKGIDSMFAGLDRAFATYPMIAIQSSSPSNHIRATKQGKISAIEHFVTRTRLRVWFLSRLMRPNEFAIGMWARLTHRS